MLDPNVRQALCRVMRVKQRGIRWRGCRKEEKRSGPSAAHAPDENVIKSRASAQSNNHTQHTSSQSSRLLSCCPWCEQNPPRAPMDSSFAAEAHELRADFAACRARSLGGHGVVSFRSAAAEPVGVIGCEALVEQFVSVRIDCALVWRRAKKVMQADESVSLVRERSLRCSAKSRRRTRCWLRTETTLCAGKPNAWRSWTCVHAQKPGR